MRSSCYNPPLTLTPAIVTRLAEIAEAVGRVAARLE